MAEQVKQEQLNLENAKPEEKKPVEESTEKPEVEKQETDQRVDGTEEKKPEPKSEEKKPEEKPEEKIEDNSVIRGMRRALKATQRELAELKRAQVQQQVANTPAPERAQFPTEGAYMQAAIDHHNRQQSAMQQAAPVDILEQTRREARKAHPDFDEALHAIDHVQFRQESLNAFAESLETLEFGPDLYYSLAKNPELAEDLSVLSPAAFAAKIGELHADIRRSKQQTVKPVSKAPAPITPVNNSTPAVKTYENMTPEEFHRVRYAERKKAKIGLQPTT